VRRTLLVFGCSLVALGAWAGQASASSLITWGASHPRLIVNRHHIARITYVDHAGVLRHVLAWGAINARAPSQSHKQVAFRIDYSGGHGSFGNGYWRRMHNFCRRYTGPPLPHLIFACDDTDGSYWALQTWRRELPDGGWRGTHRQEAKELHLSHWSGKLPALFGDTTWLSHGKYDRLFGYLRYGGSGVYGFSSTSRGNPTDSYGRNIYVDTHNPAWGRGWYRFNGALSHRAAGNFCFGVYALYGRTHPARGNEYRMTVMGPGVTPIVEWKGKAPGRYSQSVYDQKLQELDSFTPTGDSCRTT
jgi:hypothetical protein